MEVTRHGCTLLLARRAANLNKDRARRQSCCRRSVDMATTIWKGHLTFGLISMPVRMFAAARGERISFNQLHKECHSRQAALVLSRLQSQRGTVRNCEGLRIRKGP